jgi:methyl-accepting chemotaxis protein
VPENRARLCRGASEVRNLAQRSAAAAKEIKDLINDSVEKVAAGSKLVNQAGSTMDEVVDSVRKVSDIVNEISAATQEQSIGIEEVNNAIIKMDEVTQQNAALVEEAAAAAQSMQDQAVHLTNAVSVFRLDATSVSRVTRRLG